MEYDRNQFCYENDTVIAEPYCIICKGEVEHGNQTQREYGRGDIPNESSSIRRTGSADNGADALHRKGNHTLRGITETLEQLLQIGERNLDRRIGRVFDIEDILGDYKSPSHYPKN